jgi:hypothetical protein
MIGEAGEGCSGPEAGREEISIPPMRTAREIVWNVRRI